jgi:hypothetical protein
MGQSQQFLSPPIERGAFHCQQVSQLHLHTALLALRGLDWIQLNAAMFTTKTFSSGML